MLKGIFLYPEILKALASVLQAARSRNTAALAIASGEQHV
jgi:hypothetical protein